MSGLRGAIVPVTPFQQNCAILWDDDTKIGIGHRSRRGRGPHPGGDRPDRCDDRTHCADARPSGPCRRRGGPARRACRRARAARCRSRGRTSATSSCWTGSPNRRPAYGFEARNVTPDRWLREGELGDVRAASLRRAALSGPHAGVSGLRQSRGSFRCCRRRAVPGIDRAHGFRLRRPRRADQGDQDQAAAAGRRLSPSCAAMVRARPSARKRRATHSCADRRPSACPAAVGGFRRPGFA